MASFSMTEVSSITIQMYLFATGAILLFLFSFPSLFPNKFAFVRITGLVLSYGTILLAIFLPHFHNQF